MNIVTPVLKDKNSQIIDWLNEYSDVNNESSSSSSVRAAKLQGLRRASSASSD